MPAWELGVGFCQTESSTGLGLMSLNFTKLQAGSGKDRTGEGMCVSMASGIFPTRSLSRAGSAAPPVPLLTVSLRCPGGDRQGDGYVMSGAECVMGHRSQHGTLGSPASCWLSGASWLQSFTSLSCNRLTYKVCRLFPI